MNDNPEVQTAFLDFLTANAESKKINIPNVQGLIESINAAVIIVPNVKDSPNIMISKK